MWASNSIVFTFHEQTSSGNPPQLIRSVAATNFADNWTKTVSFVDPRSIRLVAGPDGSLYTGAKYGIVVEVTRFDPATGNSIWTQERSHPLSGDEFDFKLLLGTSNPIVTINDPAAPSVSVLSRINGSTLRNDPDISTGVITALAPTLSAGYTALGVTGGVGTIAQVMLKGERIARGSGSGVYGPAITDISGQGHTSGFSVLNSSPKDLGLRHNTASIATPSFEDFSAGVANAIATAGTRVAVAGQVTLANGDKQARVVHFSLDRFAANDVFGFRKNTTLNVPAPGVESNDGLAHNITPIVVTQPTHGVVSLASDGSFSYTPDADFSGIDTFTYRLGTGLNDTATVSLIGIKPTGVTLPFSVIGGQPVNARVDMLARSLVPLSVAISDNATGAAFPSTVTIPASENSGDFVGITVGVAANQNCTVTATFDGFTATGSFSIDAARPSSLVLNPNSLVGGQGFVGTVNANGPANTSGYAIAITHSGTEITTPINVLMPGGATQVSFNGTTIARSTQITHTVTATARGTSRTANLTINPGGLFGVTVAPTSIKGGTNAQGKLQTAGLAPTGGTLVAVSTDGPQITVPPTVTVDAGQQFKTFVVTSTAVSSTTPRTIIASFGTVIKTTTLTLTP